jgi:Flp pilus assembly protein TadG
MISKVHHDTSAAMQGRLYQFFRRLRRSKSGTTAVEFAIVLPLFLAFVMGVIEFGRVFWVQASLQHAVEQTARTAMAEYTRESFTSADFATWYASWGSSLEGSAPDEIFGWDPSAVTFNATTSQTSRIDYMTIDGNYNFDFLIPGVASLTLTALSKTPLIK